MENYLTNPRSDQITVLIVGASGVLGSYITKHSLQQPNLHVSILVRDRNKNKEIVDLVEKAGGRVLIGDTEKPETLVGVTKGIHTVISAISSMSNPEIFVQPQINLIDEAVRSGVERFVPSLFGFDYSKFTKDEINISPISKAKLEFESYSETLPIKTLNFGIGIFLELFFYLHAEGLTYYGDNADQKFDFTSYEDTARLVAAAVARKDLTGRVAYAGHELTLNEFCTIYNKIRGTQVSPKRLGSLLDIRRQREDKEKEGDKAGAVHAGMIWIFNEPRIKFDKIQNKDFPEVEPKSMEEFLKAHPEAKLA